MASLERDPAQSFTVGVDFGTLSGRALVVRISDGRELASAVYDYPDGVIDSRLPGTADPLPGDWALQNPADWVGVLRHAVPAAVRASGIDAADVVAIATDFTACTVLPTDRAGTPLCAKAELRARPHAWPKLWRHHAAQGQADRINALAHERKEPWIGRYGGRISSEWEFAKALQVLEEDRTVYDATERWIEAADWIVWQLTGSESRNACTAGYKGIFQGGQYPSADYLAALHPDFADFPATRLAHPLSNLGDAAGRLTAQAADWTGLPAGIVVAVGNVDAHVSAPAAQAVESGQLLAVMGTSTCHVMSADILAEVPGMCGVVEGGIIAGKYGYEAGQSGVGDIFAWWVDNNVPDAYRAEAERRGQSVHAYLTELAAQDPIGAHGLVALDWHSGNRSVLVDHRLSGLVVGLTLATRPEEVYRALLESTAFGTRRIIEAFTDSGVPVDEFVVIGGLLKNEFLMQLYADVIGRPLSIALSSQGPALGSAIHAAVAVGAYPDVPTAARSMGKLHKHAYLPDPRRQAAYDDLYAEYLRLHDYFGRPEDDGGNAVMHRLRDLRDRANSAGIDR
ncbi:ribulokinase [Jatrophihabitans telluris]|uniref:Ribulokinase n=1 Tax=Jatrophihabitans telluris TaxID=2038343 RepID=A0ABY4QXN0_9ACTN|nr:ribulokinase [Jatrophihabitans telluris]UQX88413.1 ribulokinase [Jatrophihabitans telluris]